VAQQPADFGTELRRRRLEAGLSLTGLAQRVHYSKAQLSKVERGLKKPSRQLAVLCDTVLAAEGQLAALLVTDRSRVEEPAKAGGDEEVWLMQLSSPGQSWFQPLSRRQ